jgi:CheY-like chemotaxis protein
MAADEKALTLDAAARSPLPPAVATDPTRLRQILVNLVSNAVKFTPGGRHARLLVSAEQGPEAGRGVLTFAVEDEGVGIAAEQMARLFRPFEQGDPSTTRKFGGTGLGLSISRHLAEALGGTLTVRSEPGRGACFTLRLPYEEARPARAEGEDEPAVGAPPPLTPRSAPPPAVRPGLRLAGRVLLAEDGSDNRQVVSYHLAAAGLSVEVAENGQAAVTKALAAPFDLILMDIQMPELDGYDATRLLRERGYAGPIVALTAHALPGDEEKCRRAGCTDYLSKPVEPNRLLATLARYLPPAAADDNGSGERTFRRLVGRFADALPGKVRELSDALRNGDRTALKRAAHRLRGAAGMYGFGQVGELAGLVESAVEEGQEDDLLRDLLAELAREAEVGKGDP